MLVVTCVILWKSTHRSLTFGKFVLKVCVQSCWCYVMSSVLNCVVLVVLWNVFCCILFLFILCYVTCYLYLCCDLDLCLCYVVFLGVEL
jgi:hypothetical protein